MDNSKIRWSSQTKLVVSTLLLALFVYLLFRFRAILIPLVMSFILAFILSPLVARIQRRFHIGRVSGTLLSFAVFLAVVILVPGVVIPLLIPEFTGLNLDIQLFIKQVETFLGHPYVILGYTIDGAALFRQSILSVQGLLEPVLAHTLEFIIQIISSVVWVIFVGVVTFYLVKDGPVLKVWIEKLVPPPYHQDYIRLRDEINEVWSAFLRGQLLLAVVVALIFIVIGFILGLPFALAMGVLAGLLEFLPSLGHGLWLLNATLLALLLGSTWLPLPHWVFALIVIGLHLFYQQFDLNYLIPRIVGKRVRLPPLVVILGIVTGALLAGVIGILLAAPVIASARVLGRYIYANLFDLDPFPESVVSPLPPPNPRWWRLRIKNPVDRNIKSLDDRSS
jgi:predicted PurR-regulated permease PerM